MKTGAVVRCIWTGTVGRVLGRSTMRGYLRVQFPRHVDLRRRDQIKLLASDWETWARWEAKDR